MLDFHLAWKGQGRIWISFQSIYMLVCLLCYVLLADLFEKDVRKTWIGNLGTKGASPRNEELELQKHLMCTRNTFGYCCWLHCCILMTEFVFVKSTLNLMNSYGCLTVSPAFKAPKFQSPFHLDLCICSCISTCGYGSVQHL